ncbi:hypothetical protein LMG24238_07618 [Paraburkholderia sediminicola]|uniref:Uncharacterized protein n=1 Tax=Paraburkholderia sediminicola TaxID=458836 RepID=A0A6J5CUA9_9BURK|nr:hypothetical protein LMG24238_07618 [Paraburkholderia sediminicola]
MQRWSADLQRHRPVLCVLARTAGTMLGVTSCVSLGIL